MSRRPNFSILMPTYNRANFIVQSVNSVKSQTDEDWELIIIDDGSTDGTDEKIKDLLVSDKRIRYLKQENKGPGTARNRGIEASAGEYIAFLDSDDLWHPEKLARFRRLIKDHPDGGIYYSDLRSFRDEEEMPRTLFQTWDTSPINGVVPINLAPFVPVITSAVVIKLDVFRRLGVFREDTNYMDDMEMWVHIMKDYPIYFIDEPLTHYRLHGDQVTTNNGGEYLMEGHIRVVKELLPGEYHNEALAKIYLSRILVFYRNGNTGMAFRCGIKSFVLRPRLKTLSRMAQLLIPVRLRGDIRRWLYGKRVVQAYD